VAILALNIYELASKRNRYMQNSAENLNSSSGAPGASPIDINAIVSRAKAVMTDPKTCWSAIKAENADIKTLYMKYFLVLAAIPAIARFIGHTIVGVSLPFVGTVRMPFFGSLVQGIFFYGLALGMIYIAGYILNALAPKFEGSTSLNSSIKLAGFAMIPSCIGGALEIYPNPLFWLIGLLLGLYSIYVFYMGIPEMTGVPEAKRLIYLGAAVVANIIVGFVLAAVLAVVTPSMGAGAMPTIQGGPGSPDLQKLGEGLQQLQKMLPKQ